LKNRGNISGHAIKGWVKLQCTGFWDGVLIWNNRFWLCSGHQQI